MAARPDFEYARDRMIRGQIIHRGLNDAELVKAFRAVPREAFVEPGVEEFAYEDAPLSIGEGQTISQPFIVALMIDRAEIDPGDAVLDIGTGSGYAAAVVAQMAEHIYTVERHATLAEQAERRFRRLGYRNIHVRVGDGTQGWPEAAPFDAILVAAGGPSVPQTLKEQLEIGGRLIMPVGSETDQRLIRITRTEAATFEEEDLGGVRFVPLIGAEGWQDHQPARTCEPSLPQQIAAAAEPLPDFDDPAFRALFDRFADGRVVLLGEASHGTSEFYRARAEITKRLIAEHGFNIVAVEADWPDAAALDRYVRQRPGQSLETPFQRFPTWMWRNREVWDLLAWMREHNVRTGEPQNGAGFYGLDMYNMSGSIAAVIEYLQANDPEAAQVAKERYGCLTPWQNEPSTYGRAALTSGYGRCEKAVVEQCRELLERGLKRGEREDPDLLDAAQNARLVASAERYYRVMYYGGAESWNLRDRHMFETLEHLLEARGSQAKAVVWAHNSHIGDARHTDMGSAREEINIGQLCRERFDSDAALIGFGTHEGKVAAATDWDGAMEIKTVRPSLDDSYEQLMHQSGADRFLLDFAAHPDLARRLQEPRLERFIGVVYRPETERGSHYMYASLPKQFDALVWFDHTSPVEALPSDERHPQVPETFPSGL
ncbi:protein-L-isoaspartate(D-aspartate) O-methyltransferase [Pseudorhizobium tarimense]|uniref:Protein-L-isoaspartate O-methyltransferase n=1 Tax=Pseudorhizobium tarimense TaxID=1079109 RepID=A0ABV2H2N7_9HYPH|nr:protein-L-isoaspartate(D-aspartate) O-methyltransferase [Pseudorhizobium tarimense]MCJ8517683.1 protein-L-isoaspartate(D-aspartate) O-methyltransferase [Pseudorhizobium tarimense]